MKSIETLSSILIETLKEFSSEGMGLTQESLSQALSSKKEITGLLLQDLHVLPFADHPSDQLHPCPPTGNKPECEKQSLQELDLHCRPILQRTLLKILAELAPLSKEEHLQQISELQQHLQQSKSMNDILSLSDEMVGTVRLLIGRTIEEAEYTRGFLAELGRDLSGMEKQILSCHGIHLETYNSNTRFSGELLNHADEMKDALDSRKEYGQVREFILSRLTAVKAAVDTKQKEDEARLREADRKLSDLRATLDSHREEIAQARMRVEDLEKEVLLDSLTGIHNRRAYELRIREELRRFAREGTTFSLTLIDVDHFKEINDRYGHRTGDRCLREIALRIKSSLRNIDFLARYGGEEFIAILPGSFLEGARTVAERIRAVIQRTRFRYQGGEIPVTVSLGVTEVGEADNSPEAIFTRVDNAMYRSKNDGRNRVTTL
ncbi:MAG: diguanylate cyclase [Syntrophobacteraceae bacterium]